MEGINGLLIVASALSVFCQYIDANHRTEMLAHKKDASDIDTSDETGNPGLASVKESIDDFVAKDCLRMKDFVLYLFSFLILIVLAITSHNTANLFGLLDKAELQAAGIVFISFSGVLLLTLSLFIIVRFKAMQTEKNNGITNINRLKQDYELVKKSIEYPVKINNHQNKPLREI